MDLAEYPVARTVVAAGKINTTPGIIERMRQSFLCRCQLCNGVTVHFLSKGCPQGSCLGPFLWLSLLETLLSGDFGEGTEILAYADDVLLVVSGHSRRCPRVNGQQSTSTNRPMEPKIKNRNLNPKNSGHNIWQTLKASSSPNL